MKSFVKLVLVLAVLAGAGYGAWYFIGKDRTDQTPEQKACATERGMVQQAIDKATKDAQGGAASLGVIDPGTYIHVSTPPVYYTWTTAPMGWKLQPVGTPPC